MSSENASKIVEITFPEGYLIQTERLTLRPPTVADVDGLWPHVTNPEITTFLAWEPHGSKDETQGMVQALNDAHQAGTGFHWIVLVNQQPIGIVSLIDVRRRHRSWVLNRAELAYWIAPESQSQGFATESSRAVISFAFRRLGFHKLMVYHASDNPSSGKVAQKLGFRLVGEEREAFQKNSVWHHLMQYEMLESEFDKRTTDGMKDPTK